MKAINILKFCDVIFFIFTKNFLGDGVFVLLSDSMKIILFPKLNFKYINSTKFTYTISRQVILKKLHGFIYKFFMYIWRNPSKKGSNNLISNSIIRAWNIIITCPHVWKRRIRMLWIHSFLMQYLQLLAQFGRCFHIINIPISTLAFRFSFKE